MVPLNPRGTAQEHASLISRSGARGLIADDAYAACVPATAGSLPLALSLGAQHWGRPYEQVLAAAHAGDPRGGCPEDSPFCVAYTSGTTGGRRACGHPPLPGPHPSTPLALEWGLGPGGRTSRVAPCTTAPASPSGTPRCSAAARCDAAQLGPGAAAGPDRAGAAAVGLPGAHPRADPARRGDASATATCPAWTPSTSTPPRCRSRSRSGCSTRSPRRRARAVRLHRGRGDDQPAPADARRKAGIGGPAVVHDGGPDRRRRRSRSAGEPGELFSRSPYLMNGYLDDAEATAACHPPPTAS